MTEQSTVFQLTQKIAWFKAEQPHLTDHIDYLHDLLHEETAKQPSDRQDFFSRRGLT